MSKDRIIKEELAFDFKGQQAFARWESFYAHDGSEHPDRFLHLYLDGKESDQQFSEGYKELLQEAICIKMELLREELGIVSLPSLDPNKAMEVVAKAHRGEWVGQTSASYYFYESTLTQVMTGEEYDEEFQKVIYALQAHDKFGLNGSVIISTENEKSNYLYLEKLTGHKELTRGDFDSSWSCAHCFKRGDEDTNPRDYLCDPSEFDAVLELVMERLKKKAQEDKKSKRND